MVLHEVVRQNNRDDSKFTLLQITPYNRENNKNVATSKVLRLQGSVASPRSPPGRLAHYSALHCCVRVPTRNALISFGIWNQPFRARLHRSVKAARPHTTW